METSSIVVDVLKIADIDRVNVSAELARALIGHHTYLDTKESLREHLYCAGNILDDHRSGETKLPKAVIPELEKIDAELNKFDCCYFRMIS
jgi:hypothetical protein